MSTHGEELALERHAVETLKERLERAWIGKRYVDAHTLTKELDAARDRVRELEAGP